MTNILKIQILDENNIWEKVCAKCNKDLIKGCHYVSYGPKYGQFKYHLICFNKHIKKAIKKWELMDKNMNDSLNKLNTMIKDITLDLK